MRDLGQRAHFLDRVDRTELGRLRERYDGGFDMVNTGILLSRRRNRLRRQLGAGRVDRPQARPTGEEPRSAGFVHLDVREGMGDDRAVGLRRLCQSQSIRGRSVEHEVHIALASEQRRDRGDRPFGPLVGSVPHGVPFGIGRAYGIQRRRADPRVVVGGKLSTHSIVPLLHLSAVAAPTGQPASHHTRHVPAASALDHPPRIAYNEGVPENTKDRRWQTGPSMRAISTVPSPS